MDTELDNKKQPITSFYDYLNNPIRTVFLIRSLFGVNKKVTSDKLSLSEVTFCLLTIPYSDF